MQINTGIRNADSEDSCAAQVCFITQRKFVSVMRNMEILAWICFNREKLGYWDFVSAENLSIDSKKIFPRPL